MSNKTTKKEGAILVAIDYSRASKMALKEADRISKSKGLELFCLHILDEEVVELFKKNNEFDKSGVMDFANKKLETFITQAIGSSNQIHSEIAIGNPFTEILKKLKKLNSSLLIMGANGHSHRYCHRAGALASRCVRKAPVDVLLVRRSQDGVFKSIISCVDFSENSIAAAYRAGELAEQDGAKLHLLHVYQPPLYCEPAHGFAMPDSVASSYIFIEDKLKKRLEKLQGNLAEKHPTIEITSSLKCFMSANHGIQERLEETKADLVVLGTRGRTGLKILLIGTTAERLIHDSPCSTYTVKPDGFTYKLE